MSWQTRFSPLEEAEASFGEGPDGYELRTSGRIAGLIQAVEGEPQALLAHAHSGTWRIRFLHRRTEAIADSGEQVAISRPGVLRQHLDLMPQIAFVLQPPIIGSAWTLRRYEGFMRRPVILRVTAHKAGLEISFAQPAWHLPTLDLFTLLVCCVVRSLSTASYPAGGASAPGPA